MLGVLSQLEVEATIAPYADPISGCIMRAAATLRRVCEPILTRIREKRVAGLMHDLLITELEAVFTGHPGISIFDDSDLTLLVVEDKLIVRFHWLNSDHRPSTNSTLRTQRFHRQDATDDLFCGRTNLICGYRVDMADMSIQRVILLCPNGSGYAWTSLAMNNYDYSGAETEIATIYRIDNADEPVATFEFNDQPDAKKEAANDGEDLEP